MSAKHSHNAAKKAARAGANAVSQVTPGYAPATEAPTFWECPLCGTMSGELIMADANTPCTRCGAVRIERRTFPNERLRHLDQRIRAYYADGECEIVVILGATFLETLLEDLLDRIMGAHGADVAVRSMVLDNVRAVGQRIGKLFPQLTGAEFEAAAQELGYRDFPKRWRVIRGVRNAFIHDAPYRDADEALDQNTALRTMELIDQGYGLFVSMNNRFVADGRRGREPVRTP
jgi:hypothetical protein